MLLSLNVFDKNRGNRGTAALELDFITRKWSIPAGDERGWAGIGYSYPSQGYFELQKNEVMYLYEQRSKERCPVILWNPPESEADFQHRSGQARIFEPRDPALKEGRIEWNLAARVGGGNSPLRQWVIAQLGELTSALPTENHMVRSNDPKTKDLFTKWTGTTQSGLELAWIAEGFDQVNTDEEKEKHKGKVWYRQSGVATTTTCEALVGRIMGKIRAEYHRGKLPVQRKAVGSFNLPGLSPNTGKEPATTPGWHWLKEKSLLLKPRPGDLFQVGVQVNPGQWSLRHVGIILDWDDSANPMWTTLEAGQGGPASGYDAIKKKGPRPVNPISKTEAKKVLMGWLDIDEHFSPPPATL
jgi:hypothetical protein